MSTENPCTDCGECGGCSSSDYEVDVAALARGMDGEDGDESG